jgi:hypothetical protein
MAANSDAHDPVDGLTSGFGAVIEVHPARRQEAMINVPVLFILAL